MGFEVDRLLEHPDPFHLDFSELAPRRFVAVREAFVHHYQGCAPYHRLCDARKIHPEDLRTPEDLLLIPLLSTRAFKEPLGLLSVPPEQIIKTLTSSGTSGTQSRVPKDAVTMARFIRSLERAILEVQGETGYLAMLGPSPEELGDLAFANWAAVGCRLARAHDFCLRNFEFDPPRIVARLNAATEQPVQIGGSPMLVVELANYVLESGDRVRTLGPESRITSGGGFKNLAGEVISRAQYDEKVMAAFGVPRSNIRDAYAMSELNGMTSECSENLKHVPPWWHLSVRDPADPQREARPGAEGLPAFLDPCAHSYPGFLLADDIVRLAVPDGERCRCGRIGPCLAPEVRRAEGAEARGCGRHIEELRSVAEG